jgi:26S proteasome regulatory subunit N2
MLNAKPSLFMYPSMTKHSKEAVTKPEVATTILLTTAKVKAREKKVAAEGDSMEAVSLGIF